jgi:hypothetical protein
MGTIPMGGKVKKIFFGLLFLAVVNPFSLYGQWAKTYGRPENDQIYAIAETNDGGYVAVGITESFDFWIDALVMKLSASGDIEWRRSFGGYEVDSANSVFPLEDGRIIVAGTYEDIITDFRSAMVLMLDEDGGLEWQLIYSENENTNLLSVELTSDNGFILTGVTYAEFYPEPDIVVTKLNSTGEILWEKVYSGSNDNSANTIQQTTDGGYILAANSSTFPLEETQERNCQLLRLDSSGNILWQYRYSAGADGRVDDVLQTSDGGFIISGWTKAFGAGETDCWILKIRTDGSIEWQRAFGGSRLDALNSIQETDDGGFIAAGTTTSFGAGSSDGHVTKLSASGEVEWQRTFGGTNQDELHDIQKTSEGGFIVAGCTTSFGIGEEDALVITLDSSGNIGSACPLIRTSMPLETLTTAVREETYLSVKNRTVGIETFDLYPSSPNLTTNTLCQSEKHTLLIQASVGGTTDPIPGHYVYSENSTVNIEAIPQDPGWRFDRWSGDVPSGSETNNPLAVTMNSDKEITAHFRIAVQPPQQFQGSRAENRSLTQREYINVLSWAANPDNENIVNYRIYLVDGTNQTLLVELNAQTFFYWHRNVDGNGVYAYILTAVNDSGMESEGASLTIQ